MSAIKSAFTVGTMRYILFPRVFRGELSGERSNTKKKSDSIPRSIVEEGPFADPSITRDKIRQDAPAAGEGRLPRAVIKRKISFTGYIATHAPFRYRFTVPSARTPLRSLISSFPASYLPTPFFFYSVSFQEGS